MTYLAHPECCGVREISGLDDFNTKQLASYTAEAWLGENGLVPDDAPKCSHHYQFSCYIDPLHRAEQEKRRDENTDAMTAKFRKEGYTPTRAEGGFGLIFATATDKQRPAMKRLLNMGFTKGDRFYNPNTGNWVTFFTKVLTTTVEPPKPKTQK